MGKINNTKSLCPTCLKVLSSSLKENDGKVIIKKTCPEHGDFEDIIWGDYSEYKRAENFFYNGDKIDNPRTKVERGCPYDCGICPEHKSHTILAIVDVTNRCNLRCPICFAHAGAAGYLYEPSKEEIRKILKNLKANRPIVPPALQFSGGEPTVRDDLPDLVKMAVDLGFIHVEINSNGIKMAQSLDYCKALKSAGASTVYLQFDGVTSEPYIQTRGIDLLPIKLKALKNLKAAGFHSVVLVPVLVKGINDGQVGDIIRFAMENYDIVRAVNFQPVAFTGRINKRERMSKRITIPDLMYLTEKQTNGLIRKSDWFPVPTANPFSRLIGNLNNMHFVDFCAHPHCGMATYLLKEKKEFEPITRLIDIDHFIKSIEEVNKTLESGHKTRAKIEMAAKAVQDIDLGLFRKYILPVIRHGDYESLSDLHHKMIMVGAMHFMDAFNFDLERASRCVIHYAVPDGRIIPFCTMNTIHRKEVEKRFAKPIVDSELTPLADIKAVVENS